jgi:hypothetical protein
MSRCEVCRGSKKIRIPLIRPIEINAAFRTIDPPTISSTSREYDCPECVTASDSRIFPFACNATFDRSAPMSEDDRKLQALKITASALADQLIKDGFVTLEKRDENDADADPHRYEYVSKVAVVHPSRVETIEDRINQHDAKVAHLTMGRMLEKFKQLMEFVRPHQRMVSLDGIEYAMANARDQVIEEFIDSNALHEEDRRRDDYGP